MATRLTLLCAGATASSRIGAFPAPDEPLDEAGAGKARAFRLRGGGAEAILTSPSRAAIETAEALGLDARVEPRVADLDCGDWSGRTMADIGGEAPNALGDWLADSRRAPPGGEDIGRLVQRIGAAIDALAERVPSALVVTHAMPMRAALVHCLAIPPAAANRFDFAPLTRLVLTHNRQWRLREIVPPQ